MNWRSVKPLLTESIIEEFEKYVDYKFEDSFIECIRSNNGGKPSHKVFNTSKTKERVISCLLSFNREDSTNVWITNDWNGFMADWNKDGHMNGYVAFALDAFGNLICFEKSTGCVVLINHEDQSIEKIASSFEIFIKRLKKLS